MNANKFIQLLKDNSGVSYNMVTKEYNPNKGFFVSLPNLETKVSSFKNTILSTKILFFKSILFSLKRLIN